MIIYGSRMYFHKNKVRSWCECENCGRFVKHSSYQASHFGHIYFIPLIPLGSRKQVLRECSYCNLGKHLPLKSMEPVIEELKTTFKSFFVDIQNGTTETKDEESGEMIPMGVYVASMLEDLYCLKEIESVDSVLTILSNENMEFDKFFVEGTWFELNGDLESALERFKSAARVHPDYSLTFFQVGRLAILAGEIQQAEKAFELFGKLEPDDSSGLLCLASYYEAKWDYSKIVEVYDKLLERIPELQSDRAIVKLYKKSCKKSGNHGKFLDQLS